MYSYFMVAKLNGHEKNKYRFLGINMQIKLIPGHMVHNKLKSIPGANMKNVIFREV